MDFGIQSSAATNNAGILSGTGTAATPDLLLSLGASSVPTANSIVSYDATSNIIADNYDFEGAEITAVGGSTALTISSQRMQTVTGSAAFNQTFVLPSALTLQLGHAFTFTNANTAGGIVNVLDFSNNVVLSVLNAVNGNGSRTLTLCNNSSAAGVWVVNDRSVRGRVALDTDVTVGTLQFRLNLSAGNGLQIRSTTATGNVSCHSTAVRYQGVTPTITVTQQVNIAVTPVTPVNITGSVGFTNNNNTGLIEIFEYTSGIVYRVSIFLGTTFNCIDINVK